MLSKSEQAPTMTFDKALLSSRITYKYYILWANIEQAVNGFFKKATFIFMPQRKGDKSSIL